MPRPRLGGQPPVADRRGSGVRVLVAASRHSAQRLFRPAPFFEHQRRNAPQFLILFRLADVAHFSVRACARWDQRNRLTGICRGRSGPITSILRLDMRLGGQQGFKIRNFECKMLDPGRRVRVAAHVRLVGQFEKGQHVRRQHQGRCAYRDHIRRSMAHDLRQRPLCSPCRGPGHTILFQPASRSDRRRDECASVTGLVMRQSPGLRAASGRAPSTNSAV